MTKPELARSCTCLTMSPGSRGMLVSSLHRVRINTFVFVSWTSFTELLLPLFDRVAVSHALPRQGEDTIVLDDIDDPRTSLAHHPVGVEDGRAKRGRCRSPSHDECHACAAGVDDEGAGREPALDLPT